MALSTELVITRHGEAACNVAGIVGGDRGCTGLTPRGTDQVTRLAERLRREHETIRPFDVLYASPRLRSQQSGQILADLIGVPLDTEPDLVGPNHGDADGQAWEDIKGAFKGPPQAFPTRPHAPGAEPWFSYLARTASVLARLLDMYAARRILIAAHGETIEAAHGLLLDLPFTACLRLSFRTDHASLSRWERHTNRFDRTVWMLAAHNDTAHLAS